MFPDWASREIAAFGGAWLLPDPPDVDFRGSLLCKNVEFTDALNGSVATRHGTGVAISHAEASKAITGAVNNGAGLIRITAVAHGYTTNDWVTVANVGGVPNATGSWKLIRIDADHFDLVGSTFAGAYTSGGTAVRNQAPTSAMYNWIWSTNNYLAWHVAGVGVLRTNVASPAATKIMTQTAGVAATFAPSGARLFAAFLDANGVGAAQGQVFTDGASAADALFSPPMTYVPGAPTEPGAGVVTAGLHRLGYIIEDRSGYVGRPGPDSGVGQPEVDSFVPVTFTASGAKNLQWVLNTTWPANAVKVHILMTPTTDLTDLRFVPGVSAAVTAGALESHTFTINISDEDLLAAGQNSAVPNLFYYGQKTDGTGPFNPSVVFPVGDRMGYMTTMADNKGGVESALYVSDRNNHQAITADQHLIQLPGKLPMVTSFSMGGNTYIFGPHYTFRTRDTGDVPTTWPTPELVDGKRGTLSVRGVDVSTSGVYAWVADHSGLYLFNGVFSDLPISHYQTPDWNKINWGAAQTIIVKDDLTRHRVLVLVPLEGATTPSHLMVFDYTNGMTHKAVKYSLNNYAGYSLGALEIIRNDLSGQATNNIKKQEVWLGPSNVASVLRELSDADSNIYRDNGQPINWTFRTALFPGKGRQNGIQRFHGFYARIKGAGTIAPIMGSMDGTTTVTCRTETLAASPNKEVLWLKEIVSELAYIEFGQNTLDAHATISSIKMFYSGYLGKR